MGETKSNQVVTGDLSFSDGVPRRTVVKGAAWSIPVIAAAAAVPMASASGVLKASLTIPPGCVQPGEALPDAVVEVTDDSGVVTDATVTFTFANVDGGVIEIEGKQYPTPNSTLALPQGQYTLSSVKAKTSGTVAVTATAVTTDGRTATTLTRAYAICPPLKAGNIYFWGWNAEGQVGTNPPRTDLIKVPTQESTLPEKAVALGGAVSGVVAVGQSGGTYVVGWNPNNNLGTGDGKNKNAYTKVNVSDLVYIQPSGVEENTTLAVRSDGTVWAAGWNETNLMATDLVKPGADAKVWTQVADLIPVPPGEKIVKVVQSNWGSAVYLLSNGMAYANGWNAWGATAQGTSDGTVTAGKLLVAAGHAITDKKRIADLAQGEGHILVLTTDGELWACGENDQGAVPNQKLGTRTTYLHPVRIPDGKAPSKLYAQEDFTFVVMTDGSVYAQGRNDYGQLGLGTSKSVNDLTRVILPVGLSVKKIASGNDGTIFLLSNGEVYFTGLNDTSGAGAGSPSVPASKVTTPVKVPLPGPASDIMATWYDGYAAIVDA